MAEDVHQEKGEVQPTFGWSAEQYHSPTQFVLVYDSCSCKGRCQGDGGDQVVTTCVTDARQSIWEE